MDKPLFIVIEGLDGSGKTSVSRHLTNILDVSHHGEVKLTFEPHDPSCGGLFIRQVLMKKVHGFSHNTLALAFATNRLDHCDREVNPWLKDKKGIVICDRYYLSSLVYQSSEDFSFDDVFHLNKHATKPDLIFFLDVSNKVCYERMKIRNEAKELFESNLSDTRSKFDKAIDYLKQKNHDHIIKIDASGTIEEVAEQMLNQIYQIRPDLKPSQAAISEGWFNRPSISTLSGANAHTIEIAALELGDKVIEENASLDFIKTQVDQFDFNKLAGLFLDYVSCQGVAIGDKLPWTELDAYELSFKMPSGLELKGTALVIQEKQRFDVIMKKAQLIPKMSDFMYVFSPGPSELVTKYYERSIIHYETSNNDTGLFPSTQLVTQKDLAEAVYHSIQRLKSNEVAPLEDSKASG